jgi:hypothetical protein
LVLDLLADGVVVVHLAFILFVALGPVAARRRPCLVWLHVPALAYGVGIITIGWDCPLTPLEKWLRPGDDYEGGFVDHYLEDVVWPEELTPLLWALAAVLVLVGYTGLLRRARRSRTSSARA